MSIYYGSWLFSQLLSNCGNRSYPVCAKFFCDFPNTSYCFVMSLKVSKDAILVMDSFNPIERDREGDIPLFNPLENAFIE